MSRSKRCTNLRWTPELQEQLDREIGIGAKVQKVSKRPFKSREYIESVRSKGIAPTSGRVTVVFEDGSWVEIHRCELVK